MKFDFKEAIIKILPKLIKLLKKLGLWAIGLGATMGVWFLAAYLIDNPVLLPNPILVWNTFVDSWQNGLPMNILASFWRVTQGVFLAAALSIFLGLVSTQVRWVRKFCLKFCEYLGRVPPTAVGPLLLLIFGIGEGAKVSLVFLVVFVAYLPYCIRIYEGVPRDKINAAKSYGLNRWELMRRVVIRETLPDILMGIIPQYAAGWTFVLVAEAIATKVGIGRLIQIASSRSNVKLAWALLIVMIVINTVFDGVSKWALRKAFEWRYKNDET